MKKKKRRKEKKKYINHINIHTNTLFYEVSINIS